MGDWAKKTRGKLYYFGRWGRIVDGRMERLPGDGWREALDEYLRVRDDLYAGRTPRPASEQMTLADLCSHFPAGKQRLVESGEIVDRTFRDYLDVCRRLVEHFGRHRPVTDLAPADFDSLRASLVFGGAVHAALQRFFQEQLVGRSVPLTELMEVFHQYWQAETEARTVQYAKGEDARALKERARSMLQAFLASP
ncbi:MAG TPA: hypothetical protein ENJ50_03585, partial [Planctomycetaceae bacterium]|nr:hypothetical protein [Planctomycetaceae bacterium]